jgi:hypothetical protein
MSEALEAAVKELQGADGLIWRERIATRIMPRRNLVSVIRIAC